MHGAASARAALGPDQAMMELDDMLTNREPQAKSIDLSGQSRIHTVEALEDPLKLVGRNTQAVIAHTDIHHLSQLLSWQMQCRAFAMTACWPVSC